MSNERKKLIYSILMPSLLLILMWLVKASELLLDISFVKLGVFPQDWRYLTGILTSPFIHGDLNHLISNSVPFFVLGSALFYFHRKYAYKIFFFLFIVSGIWIWLAARPAFHIGMSGVIYALASFLIFSGFIHKNKELTSISLIVVFLYGSMVWGVLPGKEGVSWEAHLYGAITGFIAALLFSKKIEQKQQNNLNISHNEYEDINTTDDSYTNIKYHYKDEN